MRDSFVFYRSFFEAIKDLDDKKRLKMYDLIANFALNNDELEQKNGICKQLFTLIKPQISANNKRFEAGSKGGRPAKNKTNGFMQKKPNVNENVNENVNVYLPPISPLNEKRGKEKTKEDPFLSEKVSKFLEIYKKEVKKPCRLSPDERLILLNILNDLIMQGLTIDEISQTVCCNLSKSHASGFFKKEAGINWLLRENNFYAVLNGEFLPKTDADTGGRGTESREKDRAAVLEFIAKRKAKEIKENEC